MFFAVPFLIVGLVLLALWVVAEVASQTTEGDHHADQ
jgi:hypothetical protein